MLLLKPIKHQYKKYYCWVVLVLLCGIGQIAAQPMAGVYTINQNAAATGTNFTSFQSFFNTLSNRGVGGSVTANVVVGSGPYIEQVNAVAVTGANTTNTITINGNNETLQYVATSSTQKHTIKFDGADFINLKNLKIEAQGSSYAWAVHLTNGADNNTIENCTIKISNYTGIWDGIGIVVAASNTNALTAGTAAKNLTVSYCQIEGDANAGAGIGIVLNPQANGTISANIVVQNTQVENFSSTGIYLTNCKGVSIKQNKILRPLRKLVDDTYGIRVVNSNKEDTILGNQIVNCFAAVSGASLFKKFYGINIENSLGDIVVANNAIYNNSNQGNWYGIFMGCSQNTKIWHNTIAATLQSATVGVLYGFYHDNAVCNNSAGSEFKNNIIAITRGGSNSRYGIYQNSGAITINYNNIYITGAAARVGWATKDYITLADWQAAVAAGSPYGQNSTAVMPQFVDVQAGNLTPQAIAIDNTANTVGVTTDINGQSRSTSAPDVGAYEFSVDANVSRIANINPTNCVASSDSVGVWIVNKSASSILNFQVGYTLTGQTEVLEDFLDTIPANDSALYIFSQPLTYTKAGNLVIQGRIKGKNQAGTKLLFIYDQPDGSRFVKAKNFQGFFKIGDAPDPDVVLIGDTAQYNISTPNGFSDINYGNTWQIVSLEARVINSSKIVPPSTIRLIGANSFSNAQLSFMPVASLNGETVRLTLQIQNIATGCISEIVERYIKIVTKPIAIFSAQNGCMGGIISFLNSSIGGGQLNYKWFFGDGDSAQATQPQKVYGLAGQYKVVLYAYNSDGFFDSTTIQITIYPTPDVDFDFKNQCEGITINFNNTAKSYNGAPHYQWDFGDGSGTSTQKNPSYLYATYGFYNVSLTVTDSLGCYAQQNKQVTFANKPEAKFSFPALSCNQKKIAFTNNTSNSSAVGFTWLFGDGDSSIIRHAEHTYLVEGTYTVSLLARNGFNCVDTQQSTIKLLGTPQPDFSVNTTCINQLVVFANNTKPLLNANIKYEWLLDKTIASTDTNPVYTFTALGKVEIYLKATADNGCFADVKKEITITQKPTADFVIPQNICQGIGYQAINNTTPANIAISYTWLLGNKSSSLPSPVDTFNAAGVYTIRLVAATSAGCADTASKTLNVIKFPDSDFTVKSRQTADGTMIFEPKEIEGAGSYKWLYGNGASDTVKNTHQYKFAIAGTYTVTLQIANQGCASTTSKKVNINPLAVTRPNTSLLKLYPNPATNTVSVDVGANERIEKIIIYSLMGQKVVETFDFDATTLSNKTLPLNLKNGGYTITVITENAIYTGKLYIVK